MTRKRKALADRRNDGTAGSTATAVVRSLHAMRPIAVALFPPLVVAFVMLFAWYLWAVVDLRLVFQARDSLFLWNVRYFTDFLGQPGSLLVWADRLLVQLCYNGWPAAIAVAVAAWLLLVSTVAAMNAMGRGSIGGTWVIPSVLLVALFGGYAFPTPVLVGSALAMAAAAGWCRLPSSRPRLRLAIFVVISAVLYYVVGVAFYCFAACGLIYEVLVSRRWLSGVLLLLVAVVVKFGLDVFLANYDLATHNFNVLSLESEEGVRWDWRVVALYFYFPTCALFVVCRRAVSTSMGTLLHRLRGSPREDPVPEHDGAKPTKVGQPDRGIVRTKIMPWLRWTATTVLLLSPAAAAGFACLDRARKTPLEIDYCAEHQLWDSVLAKAKTLPPADYSRYVNHDVNLALYHTGQMPYQLFSYRQVYRPLLDIRDVTRDAALANKGSLVRKPIDLLLQLGRVNEAEHLAMEMYEMWPSGGAIRRLALVEMVKGQSSAARGFLNVLRDDLVWGRWADDYLRRLDVDGNLMGDEDIQRMRRLMIVKDDLPRIGRFLPTGEVSLDVGGSLLSLLRRNAANRMAFEYLMSMCLCSNNVQAAHELFGFLDDQPYKQTPPLYEQAAILHVVKHPEIAVTDGSHLLCHGRPISESTVAKYNRLQEIAGRCGGFSEKTERAVVDDLGDTYFYYFFFTSRKRS
jgi:hypothetical protein